MATTIYTGSPDRWARFLEDAAPGLSWLAATLLEWSDLPPGARRSWRVTVSSTREGDPTALAALHDQTGLLVVAAAAGQPPPFLGEPDRVMRLLGEPGTLDEVFQGQPMLAVRRLPGFRRRVFLYDYDPPIPHPGLRRARAEEWERLDHLRSESDSDGAGDAADAPDLAGPAQSGHLWVVEDERGPVGMFRVEGVSRRRVQMTDVGVHPRARGRGIGTALMRSAAYVARTEYALGAVLTLPDDEAAVRAAQRAGFAPGGILDDVRLA